MLCKNKPALGFTLLVLVVTGERNSLEADCHKVGCERVVMYVITSISEESDLQGRILINDNTIQAIGTTISLQ
jgi:hypothetical protein